MCSTHIIAGYLDGERTRDGACIPVHLGLVFKGWANKVRAGQRFYFKISKLWKMTVHCCYVHVCFVQVTMCGAPDMLTCLGARTFLLLSHLLGSQNKYQ